ncbi:hypothetical protein C8Q69DRAFT_472054 [Paecilomyces variotii]|uniref:Uncharacterized protein n=1 Tax=Byssochlamys spectabilis TaxID=264951 RepID=A0A443HQ43_BYSSP|nr:hypothetical protein C8Q69DRAFT_472054 [Paecilomyces variotii]RWQ93935.1 hypothetical protein C8Q69DRAFT_472054 [Paecilomyces variotii]
MESSHDACYAFLSPWHKSGSHNTASINGRHQEDPDGWHLTFCYKDSTRLANGTHTACHGYTPGKRRMGAGEIYPCRCQVRLCFEEKRKSCVAGRE